MQIAIAQPITPSTQETWKYTALDAALKNVGTQEWAAGSGDVGFSVSGWPQLARSIAPVSVSVENALFERARNAPVYKLMIDQSQSEPIIIRYRAQSDTRAHLIIDVALAEGVHATIIEEFEGDAASNYWNNILMPITLAPNSSLQHYRVQNEALSAVHTHSTFLNAAKHSEYSLTSFGLGAAMARQEVHSTLHTRARVSLNGVYLGKAHQQFDHYLPTSHMGEAAFSQQRFRGVLDDHAKGVFYGRVSVPPSAQKTDAHQHCQHLLLSDSAEAYARPELEILADDVKCSHGAAIGAVDEQAMFYLQARGLQKEQALALLVEGFISEILEHVQLDWLHEAWKKRAQEWLISHP